MAPHRRTSKGASTIAPDSSTLRPPAPATRAGPPAPADALIYVAHAAQALILRAAPAGASAWSQSTSSGRGRRRTPAPGVCDLISASKCVYLGSRSHEFLQSNTARSQRSLSARSSSSRCGDSHCCASRPGPWQSRSGRGVRLAGGGVAVVLDAGVAIAGTWMSAHTMGQRRSRGAASALR
ncbi:hypothetical protein B0J12DRAFT_331374 [Macrophomina phaseolina]|uniref:Uncharacterized protein n=1 Tax=Macrophomina phaseolina TaxID=35725 RepID=A0ABQ8GLA2_9PEZI|nr:hypothetical protein B0J12DRAFT_331374 [Macrophomina phaseolina]